MVREDEDVEKKVGELVDPTSLRQVWVHTVQYSTVYVMNKRNYGDSSNFLDLSSIKLKRVS
jgi:hypothetical protein